MKLFLFFFAALILLGLTAFLLGRYSNRKDEGEETTSPPPTDGECCGQHAICERDSLLAGVSKKIEYYDDEELDRFRGTPSNLYKDEAIDEFRNILYTRHEEDVPGWVRSLQLRGIELPDSIKDEVILIVNDLRTHTHQS